MSMSNEQLIASIVALDEQLTIVAKETQDETHPLCRCAATAIYLLLLNSGNVNNEVIYKTNEDGEKLSYYIEPLSYSVNAKGERRDDTHYSISYKAETASVNEHGETDVYHENYITYIPVM